MPRLAGTLTLGDIRNVEKLCQHVLHLERPARNLNGTDYDDLLAYLIVTTWELHQRYNPNLDQAQTKGRTPSFASYATYILRLRARRWLTNNRQRQQHDTDTTVHIEELFNEWDEHHPADVRATRNPQLRRVVESLASSDMDPAEHSDPLLGRILESRDRGSLQQNDPLDNLPNQ